MEQGRVVPAVENHRRPEPGIEVVVWSLLVIGGCILLVTFAIVLIAMNWRNPFFVIISVLSLLYFPALGLAQYGATFRRSAWSTAAVASLLRLLGGFWLVAYMVLFGLGVLFGEGLSFITTTLPWVLPPVFCLLLAMYVNYRWARSLESKSRGTLNSGEQPWQISTREIFLVTAVAAVISAFVACLIRSS